MKYSDYTTLLSSARMSKYIKACNGDKAKAISLYITISNCPSVCSL